MSNKNIVTKEIPFHGDKLLGVKTEDGKVWLAVSRTCLGIGLTEDQSKKQSRNIQNSLLFNGKSRGNQEVIVISAGSRKSAA